MSHVTGPRPASTPAAFENLGLILAKIGIVLPLLFIGGLKFTPPEVEALRGLIGSTPWLAWLYPLFGVAGASHFLGIVEISAALFLLASFRWRWAGLIGGIAAMLTFLVTSSLLLLPLSWDPQFGGFPYLSPVGQFVIKDITLLGVAVAVVGKSLRTAKGGVEPGL